MTYDPSIHHRKSIRLKEYDYAESGMYFFTVCCHDKKALLGHISEGEIELNRFGEIVHEVWLDLPKHYAQIKLDEFVVMPNHIHAVVVIDGEKVPYKRNITEQQHNVETWRAASLQSETMTNIANMQGWLSVVIGGLKSAITKYAHDNGIPFAWQTRFYDRIVRSQDELNRIGEYIQSNVAQWSIDKLNIDIK